MRRRGVRALAAVAACAFLAGAPGCSRSPRDEMRTRAERGDSGAQFSLGMRYAKGQDLPRDYEQAVSWWRKAADQGDVRAQFNLGVLFATGEGVKRDDREAEKWWRRAADHGDVNAQFNLGVVYAEGRGVPADHAEAYKWYSLVAAKLNAETREAAAHNREVLAAKMSAAQLAEGQRRAAAWKPVARGR